MQTERLEEFQKRLNRPEKPFVFDTGLLLIHSSGVFGERDILKRAIPFKLKEHPLEECIKIFNMIDRIMISSNRIIITPNVLSELCSLAKSRLGLRNNRLKKFLDKYAHYLEKMEESYIEKNILLKNEACSKLCFTDISLALTAKNKKTVLYTTDRILKDWCRAHGIEAKEFYYDIFLPEAIRE